MTNRAYGMGGMGYGVGYSGYATGYGTGYGTGTGYGMGYGANYGAGPAGYPPYNSMYSGYGAGYGGGYGYGGIGTYAAHGCYNDVGRYANPFLLLQSSYYYGGVGGAVVPYPSYSYVLPSSTAVVTATAAQTQSQNTPPVQYTYVTAAATPTTLPIAYYTSERRDTATTPTHTHTATARGRYATGTPHGRPATREELNHEARRIATESGAYRPRRIKPADADPNDQFWCRERDGEWHLRKYYQIENECHPGRWQMDAEVGFLVFHRD
jgi:hypothetical protein